MLKCQHCHNEVIGGYLRYCSFCGGYLPKVTTKLAGIYRIDKNAPAIVKAWLYLKNHSFWGQVPIPLMLSYLGIIPIGISLFLVQFTPLKYLAYYIHISTIEDAPSNSTVLLTFVLILVMIATLFLIEDMSEKYTD